ncbi:hypothetical protein QOZ80_4BG0348290 [Eleusine coracana subsp. coracana]|nr:hypothetical protein QOZ80_4BG0348290 [Eleusine coracana subsp. coracana]
MGDQTTLDELKLLITALSTNVNTLVTNVSSIKADQPRLHVAVNKVQSEVLGDGSSSSNKGKGIAGDAPGGPARTASHKLWFPKYDRAADPLAWLHCYDQFFWASRTSEDEKVWYAAFYLDGDA